MNANELLLWLSARGSGTWDRYRSTVDELQAAEQQDGDAEDAIDQGAGYNGFPIHHRLRSILESLGHAEFLRSEGRWQVVPPTLACITSEDGVLATVCGARTDHLLARMEQAASHLRIERTPQNESPDRIQILAKDASQLQDVSRTSGFLFQPDAARTLLAVIPPVDHWQLQSPAELPSGHDWEVKRFSTSTLGWADARADDARTASFGLFRFAVYSQPHYYLRLKARTLKVPVQVGKYIALRRDRRKVVQIDHAARTMRMPVSCRPPILVDRALAMCSGLLPHFEGGQLVYKNVTPDMAFTVRELLRQ